VVKNVASQSLEVKKLAYLYLLDYAEKSSLFGSLDFELYILFGSGSEGGDAKSKLVTGGAEEASAVTTDVIFLDVGGMTCGGCAASVKRILESQ
ncbi:hypothetical protein UlMin_025653, partial [Ulmus minor]